MANRNDDGLLREIDEEIRREQYALLWRKYGSRVIAAAVLLVVGVAVQQVWQNRDRENREALTRRLHAAVRTPKTESDKALELADRLSREGVGGAALLAKLRKAALLRERGEAKVAADLYRSIASDEDTPKTYRGLALVEGAAIEIDMDGPPADLRDRLSALTASDNPWRHAADELLGLLALKQADRKTARGIFKTLAEDATTPAGARDRARRLAESIGERR